MNKKLDVVQFEEGIDCSACGGNLGESDPFMVETKNSVFWFCDRCWGKNYAQGVGQLLEALGYELKITTKP